MFMGTKGCAIHTQPFVVAMILIIKANFARDILRGSARYFKFGRMVHGNEKEEPQVEYKEKVQRT
jgi:hypothetical protein